MKRLGLGNILQNVTAGARNMLTKSSRAKASRAPERNAWHDHLAPQRLMEDFLAPQHAALAGASPALRDKILTRAKSVMQTPVGEAMCQKFLDFMGNAEAGRGEREDTGMRSDVACWMMFRLLHSMAPSTPQNPREQAAFEHLLLAYRGYFASALVNQCFRNQSEHKAEHAELQMRILAANLRPTQATMLHSGYSGHTTLMRVGVLSNASNDKPPDGSLMQGYRHQVTRKLGVHATPWLASHYQLNMTEALLRTPVIDGLITSTHALVHPATEPGMAQVTWRAETGKTKTTALRVSEVESFLQNTGLLAVPNGLKATIHNGGSGARIGHAGTVRTYDQRLLLPLTEAQGVLSNLQSAKLDDGPTAARAMRGAAQYDGSAIASMVISPAMRGQSFGNCTVHSQKLCLLYALQHLRELGDPEALNAHEGANLFARIWTAGFERVSRGIRDPQARRDAKHMAAKVQVETAAMLAPKTPTESRRHEPAVRQLAPMERVRRPADYGVPAAQPREAELLPLDAVLPPAALQGLPPRSPRPATPPALAVWGAEAPGDAPPTALLTWFSSVQGTAWAPADIAETKAFDRIQGHLKTKQTDGREHQKLNTWIDGEAFLRRGHAATEQIANDTAAPSPEILEDLRNFAFAIRSDANLAIKAMPNGFLQALTKASRIDSFTGYLRDRLFAQE